MKKIFLSLILFCLQAAVCFSQKTKETSKPSAVKPTTKQTTKQEAAKKTDKPTVKQLVKPAAKPVVKSTVAAAKPPVKSVFEGSLTEVPDVEWKNLIDAVENEKWEKSALLADGYLAKIKFENSKKHIARLRYILLYALAGKVSSASLAGKKPEENQARIELEKTANSFLGKEFFMPSRLISDDCQRRLNYICPAKQQKNVLRVTAANRDATAIHSFEYIRLKENFNFGENLGKQAIAGGLLKKIEFNSDKSNVWIMRLYFENGVINIVPNN